MSIYILLSDEHGYRASLKASQVEAKTQLLPICNGTRLRRTGRSPSLLIMLIGWQCCQLFHILVAGHRKRTLLAVLPNDFACVSQENRCAFPSSRGEFILPIPGISLCVRYHSGADLCIWPTVFQQAIHAKTAVAQCVIHTLVPVNVKFFNVGR